MKVMIIKVVAPVLIILAGVATMQMLESGKPKPEKKTEAVRPLSVYVEYAKQSDVSLLVSTQGEVSARTEVNLVAQVAGKIESISSEFTEGGIVSSDVALINIEDTDYQLALAQAQAAVAEAEVGVQEALATANVARKQLQNPAKASPLALKKPQVAQAKARLEAARASLAQAELNLQRTKISLPFNGRVIEKNVDIGQYVTPGSSLGRAFSTDIVEVRVPFDDDELASLDLPIGYVAENEAPLRVNLSATVAGKIQNWQGELVRLDAAVDSNTRTVYGQVVVKSPYQDNVSENGMPLAVGLYVQAEIQGRRINGATVIPRDALRAGNNVFVIDADERLDIRQVNVVHSSSEQAIIGDGIQADEKVIVSSIRNPIPGMRLSPLESSEQATAEKKTQQPEDKVVTLAGGL